MGEILSVYVREADGHLGHQAKENGAIADVAKVSKSIKWERFLIVDSILFDSILFYSILIPRLFG